MFETAMFLDLMEKFRDLCYRNSKAKGFWGKEGDNYNFPEKIALIHSELSELLEAWRNNKTDSDKDIRILDLIKSNDGVLFGSRRMTAIEEEIADVFIRLMDLCGKLDIDVGRVVLAKMEYNSNRPFLHGGRRC